MPDRGIVIQPLPARQVLKCVSAGPAVRVDAYVASLETPECCSLFLNSLLRNGQTLQHPSPGESPRAPTECISNHRNSPALYPQLDFQGGFGGRKLPR